VGFGGVFNLQPNIDDHSQKFQEVVYFWVTEERTRLWDSDTPCPAGGAVTADAKGACVGPADARGSLSDNLIHRNSGGGFGKEALPKPEDLELVPSMVTFRKASRSILSRNRPRK
jgi:hypothetical protein